MYENLVDRTENMFEKMRRNKGGSDFVSPENSSRKPKSGGNELPVSEAEQLADEIVVGWKSKYGKYFSATVFGEPTVDFLKNKGKLEKVFDDVLALKGQDRLGKSFLFVNQDGSRREESSLYIDVNDDPETIQTFILKNTGRGDL